MNKHSTFARYFLSYFIILFLSLTGFIVIIQTRLTKIYSEQLDTNVENRLNAVQNQFLSNLESIIQTHIQLKQDMSLLNYRYEPTPSNRHELYQQLHKYDTSNDFITSIIYLDQNNSDILTTNYIISHTNDTFYIHDYKGNFESFHIENKLAGENTLFLLSEENPLYLLYLPNDTKSNYLLTYMIDLTELIKLLKNHQIDGIHAFAFVNSDLSLLCGINTETISSVITDFPTETGIYPCSNEYSLYIHSNIYEDFSLVALYSTNAYSAQLYATFRTVYYLLFLIGLIGFLLIFFSMRLTYFPLAKLVQRVIPETSSSQSFIVQLDNAFSTTLTEKNLLQGKIDKYHLSILNSLLDSGIDDSIKSNYSNITNIDQIFHTDCNNCIYMLRIHFEMSPIPDEKIHLFLRSMLPKESASFTLESGTDYRVYVVNYIGADFEKDDVIYSLMSDLHKKYGCYCAISNSVSSLIDIPSLYENTLLACNAWPDLPVVAYSDIAAQCPNANNAIYPYKLLNKFNETLNKLDFSEAHELLTHLLLQVDKLSASNSKYPDFIIRCLLIDILMALISSMNQHDVKFTHYRELYFETLYYCRNWEWPEKESEIRDGLLKLLELFQSEQHKIRTCQIQEYLEQHFASEELTITTLADHFNVSIAYMSYLFKKEFKENFSDYLWRLRFRKATDMLLHTDLTIDDISIYVGYVNPSSFRRKFKQKTGMTPSQYRTNGNCKKPD